MIVAEVVKGKIDNGAVPNLERRGCRAIRATVSAGLVGVVGQPELRADGGRHPLGAAGAPVPCMAEIGTGALNLRASISGEA